MTDWNGLFRTEEFKSFRKRQIEKVAEVLEVALYSTVIGSSGDLDAIKGMLNMARILIKLPEELTKDAELEGELELQLMTDMAHMTTHLLRKRISG
jgi:hypothetical protein